MKIFYNSHKLAMYMKHKLLTFLKVLELEFGQHLFWSVTRQYHPHKHNA